MIDPRHRTALVGATLLLLGILAIPASAQETSLTIDFTSTAFLDAPATTAVWDTVEGRLHLPYFTANEIGTVSSSNMSWVDVQGRYAYVGRGLAGLSVFDVSDPTSPTIVFEEGATGRDIRQVKAFGHILFAAGPNQGLHLYDITNRTLPVFAGTASAYTDMHGIAVDGSLLYLADGANGLRILTVLGGAIAPIGYLNTPVSALDVDAHGGIAVVADNTALRIIDVSDPTAPVEISSYATLYATSVQIVGTLVYAAAGLDMLILDISDPTTPVPVGSYPTSNMVSVSVDGDYAVIGTLQGLELVDVRDPASPVLQYSQSSGDEGGEAVEIAGRTFWTDGDTFRILETALPIPYGVLYRHYRDLGVGPVFGMCSEGEVLYVLRLNESDQQRLTAYDLTDAMNPAFLGEVALPGSGDPGGPRGVAAYGGIVYAARGSEGLRRYDFRDPTSPQYLGTSHASDAIFNLELNGDILAVDGVDSLYVLALRDPLNPVQLYSTLSNADGIAMYGIFGFYPLGSTLHVLNLATGSEITTLSLGELPKQGLLETDGQYLYMFGNTSGDILVVDVRNPQSPSLVPPSSNTYYPESSALAGDRLYVQDGQYVNIVDVSDPTNVVETGYVALDPLPGFLEGRVMHRVGDYLYVGREIDSFVVPLLNHRVDPSQDEASTIDLDAYNQGALASRVLADKTASVRISLASGISDGEWTNSIGAEGGDAYFVLQPTSSLVDPSVNEVTFEWAYEGPRITDITDTPNDQGKQVRVGWIKSANDHGGYIPGNLVTEYSVYRRIEANYAPGLPLGTLTAPPGDWDFLATVPADAVPTEGHYSVVVPTLADSTLSAGMHWTTFYVRARTDVIGSTYDSPPDSGYSVDNLAPSVPAGFLAMAGSGGAVELVWDPNPEEDVQFYHLYRGSSDDFVLDETTRIGSTAGTAFTDPAPGGDTHYKVTAVDFSGNESLAALTSGVTGVPLPSITSRFQLYPARPNPFRAGSRVAFEVPEGGAEISLAVYDVRGRLVRSLYRGWRDAGVAELTWDGRDERGADVPGGVYFLRFAAPGFEEKARLVRLR